MGRHTEQKKQARDVPTDKSNPNRKWVRMLNNINVLDSNKWNYVKKKLPHKKQGEGKSISSQDNEVNEVSDEANESTKQTVCIGGVCTLNNSQPEEKSTRESSAARKGRAARLKAMLAKDVLRKKGRHRRSSTCPADSEPMDNSIEHIQDVDVETSTPKRNLHSEQPPDDEEEPIPLNLKGMANMGRSATFHQSKELLDALDVLSFNKDFFLKVLEDPESSLTKHFMVQQASGKRKGLEKSRTFAEGRDFAFHLVDPNRNTSPKENNNKAFRHLQVSPLHLDNLSECQGNQFRDLKQKIRHVIKESKKERHRIAMDAVFDKVPHGHHLSETQKDKVEQLDIELDDRDSPRFSRKDRKKSMQRSHSLNESMGKYRQLFESSFSREPKRRSSDAPKVQNENEIGQRGRASLKRMSSSPDLSTCLARPLDDSNCAFPSALPNVVDLRRRLITPSRSFSGIDTLGKLTSTGEIVTKERKEETNEGGQGTMSLVGAGGISQSHSTGLEEPWPDSTPEPSAPENYRSPEKSALSSEDPCLRKQQEAKALDPPPSTSFQVQVKTKNKEDFIYVKDILQLSGCSGNQVLGKPMDHSLFQELESCSFQEPGHSGFEEDSRSNRLLLFNLINEVLLSIYEKSMTYWHSPLTTISRIHPMPMGHHVLENVWNHVSWYMESEANQLESSLEHLVTRDLGEDDGWMNLQFEAEGVSLEVEDLIFEDLIMEIMASS